MARQRLGQHFLPISIGAKRLRAHIRVSPHSTRPAPQDDEHCWIEIGQDTVNMTQHLLATASRHASNSMPRSCPAFAISEDNSPTSRFPATFSSGHRPKSPPAAASVSTAIFLITLRRPFFHHLFDFANSIDEIHVVIQTEVALRIAAQPTTRDYGYLSRRRQFYTRPEFVFEIPREAFNPPPEVTSALVTLRLPGERAKLSLASSAPPAGGRGKLVPRCRSLFLDFGKIVLLAEAQDAGHNLRAHRQIRSRPARPWPH